GRRGPGTGTAGCAPSCGGGARPYCSPFRRRSSLLLADPLRAPGDALCLEFIERAAQGAPVEYHPSDQRGDDHERGDISSHDESGVWAEIHRHAPAVALACSISKLRMRRRMISLRMAARCNVRNSSVKATSMAINGMRIVG